MGDKFIGNLKKYHVQYIQFAFSKEDAVEEANKKLGKGYHFVVSDFVPPAQLTVDNNSRIEQAMAINREIKRDIDNLQELLGLLKPGKTSQK